MDAQLLADLGEEHWVLDRLVSAPAVDWERPTPAAGWSVADTVRHLVVSDRAATASLVDLVDPIAPGKGGVSNIPVDGPGLLAAWRESRSFMLGAFGAVEDGERVPWGGRQMAARSLATARLMETWAHGLDCFEALGVRPVDTDRLAHVAWLGWKTLPYAFSVAGLTPLEPPGQLLVELTSPGGGLWSFGPADARSVIRGGAGEWCRVVTHRDRSGERRRMVARGDLAVSSLVVARAFL